MWGFQRKRAGAPRRRLPPLVLLETRSPPCSLGSPKPCRTGVLEEQEAGLRQERRVLISLTDLHHPFCLGGKAQPVSPFAKSLP